MLLSELIALVPSWGFALLAVLLLCLRAASFRYQKGLNKYKGPFLASFTNFWRLWQYMWHWDRPYFPRVTKYGKIIRVGPNTLLFNDPEAIKDIYMTHFSKSDFYKVGQGVSKGVAVPNIFSTTDRIYHGKLRRSVANAFAMSTLVNYEPFVTDTVTTFLTELNNRFAGKGGTDGICDMSEWTKYFALDVVSALTMGKSYGLLKAGYDNIGIIKARTDFLRYFTIVNNMTWLDKCLKKNPIIMWLGRHGFYNSVTATVPIAQRQMLEKQRVFKPLDESMKTSKAPIDLLTKFLQAKVDNPQIVDDRAVLGLTLSMVNAGSGTVSTTLAAIFYFLLKHPDVLEKLVAEIDAHFPPPTNEKAPINFVDYIVPFSKSQELPFLDAVVKEIFRLWPGLGAQLIERVTPPEGAYILGEHIPGNIIVSCNAWIMHRHKPTYGEDVEEFRPSRWLDADSEKVAAMNKALLVFGAGPNTCIGKNIGLLELYKVVPSTLRMFKMELVDPSKSWKIYNLGDPEPSEFFVRLQPRFQK
ncbi:cytochrome P450 oxidoreductase [Xylogone sp. PMI_703]|nr:cytochrome P450 oxidoreductase [Xylogone sp. PMI_703]